MRIAVALMSLALLTGCSIKQTVTPASIAPPPSNEICMIPAEGLRDGFHTTYSKLLVDKGFSVRKLSSSASPSSCSLATTYVGNWAWDLALYMVYADIKVYQDGRQVGHANYDAKWGGGRPDKFIDAENKITELVEKLFPNGAPAKAATVATSSDSPSAASKEERLQQLMNDSDLSYEEYMRKRKAIIAE
ncbi:conserved exported hypothetical protein [Pseudomonas sp. 8AS]|uniref:Sbal_3080 family lipoprotein n=1 Tax=Pseudomonas sp. 8AS TaxID=2653163 RepID=UPI0012F1B8B0|nr:Sbal_3080 family lipoprotein [Pseudomonas sp. 8AS]VXC34501.1 conserved exported hypothetical protein [Pseudomonas sp. 8AS]